MGSSSPAAAFEAGHPDGQWAMTAALVPLAVPMGRHRRGRRLHVVAAPAGLAA